MIIDRVATDSVYLESMPGDCLYGIAGRADEHGYRFILFNDRVYYLTESHDIIPTMMSKEHLY